MEAEAVNQPAETAGPDVVDDSAGTEIVVPSTNVEGLKGLAQQLSALHQRFHNVAHNLATTAGDKQARRDRADLVRTRTTIVKSAADLKRDLRASVAAKIVEIDTDADRMVAFIKRYEDPLDQQITADEQRREREREERDAAEAERQAGHRDRINDIVNIAVRAAGMASAEIQSKIDLVTRIVVDDSFEEFKSLAINSKAETLLKLADLLSNAKSIEEREAQAQRDREELVRLQQAQRERDERETAERAEQQRLDAEQQRAADEERAAKQRAEDARRAQSNAANDLVDEIRRIQRRALTASGTGMLELLTLVENIRPGDELGDFVGVAQKAKDDALADLHELHEQRLTQEKQRRTDEDTARQLREKQQQHDMWMQQIDGINQQSAIARVGRAPYYTGGNVVDVEKIIAETEAWVIDAANFGGMQKVAENVKTAVLADLRDYLLTLLKATEVEALREAELRQEQEQSEAPPLVPFESVQISSADAQAVELTPVDVVFTESEHERRFTPMMRAQQAGATNLPAELDADMTCVPILQAFDQKEPIGQLQILTKHLPPSPDYVFALGFMGIDYAGEPGVVPTERYDGKYKLFAVSPVADENYVGYLRQIGVQPSAVDFDRTVDDELVNAVASMMKAATLKPRGGKPGPWIVPHDEMAAVKAALRKQMLPGGQFYSEDGTLTNADGSRSVCDDVDQ